MWEVRSLFLVAVGVSMFFVHQPTAAIVTGLGMLVVVVMVRSIFIFLAIVGQAFVFKIPRPVLILLLCRTLPFLL